MTQALYTDGGCIGANPSPLGGTFAWCLVDSDIDQIIRSASGIILPADYDGQPISNNVAELRAAVEGIEAMPEGWTGTIHSDSQITLGRLFENWSTKGIPDALWSRLYHVKNGRIYGGSIKWVLLQGHPTRADLGCGVGAKRHLPVSKWNQWADRECQRLAREYLAEKQKAGGVG